MNFKRFENHRSNFLSCTLVFSRRFIIQAQRICAEANSYLTQDLLAQFRSINNFYSHFLFCNTVDSQLDQAYRKWVFVNNLKRGSSNFGANKNFKLSNFTHQFDHDRVFLREDKDPLTEFDFETYFYPRCFNFCFRIDLRKSWNFYKHLRNLPCCFNFSTFVKCVWTLYDIRELSFN